MSHATRCRSCVAEPLEQVCKREIPASLGSPPHLALDTSWELGFCPRCTLVQRSDPWQASGEASRLALASLPVRQLTRQVIAAQKLRPTSLVVEIGSRDGRLLSEYQQASIPVLGIEPASRLAELARLERGIPTLNRRFDMYLAAQLVTCSQPADVVHLHEVLSLIDDPNEVAAGLAMLLKDSGVAVLEVPYVRAMLDRGDLWSPHQSAISFYSLTSLYALLERHRLIVHDIDVLHESGTLRVFAGCRGATSERVNTLLTEERDWGVDRLASYLPRRQTKVA